jgi:pyruvate dehydrogenase E2 component (dihydrolipoamide acetyltransferase)
MSDIGMPRLSDSMEEGVVIQWLKQSGDEVKRGDELVEIETDKATMVYEADCSGVLEIKAEPGETLAIGELIAVIAEAGNEKPAVDMAPAVSAAASEEPPVIPAPSPEPVGRQDALAAPRPSDEYSPAVHSSLAQMWPLDVERIKVSPVAHRLAAEQQIDLQQLAGSGPAGRIVKADLPAVSNAVAELPATAEVSQESLTGKGETIVTEPSRTQTLIARRMSESRATVPSFTLQITVDMSSAVQLRNELKASVIEGQTVATINDMVVKACALALREQPQANGAWKDGRFEHYSRINIGVAVAGPGTLVVPTVFDADQKTLSQISAISSAMAAQVREGTITPPQTSGGTFTVSNLGMFGISNFEAVINTPQAAILAVGVVSERAAVKDGELMARMMMDLSLSCDHRILYGVDGASLLARIKTLLEAPLALA